MLLSCPLLLVQGGEERERRKEEECENEGIVEIKEKERMSLPHLIVRAIMAKSGERG